MAYLNVRHNNTVHLALVLKLEHATGFKPATSALQVRRSISWTSRAKFGPLGRIRTRLIQFRKLMPNPLDHEGEWHALYGIQSIHLGYSQALLFYTHTVRGTTQSMLFVRLGQLTGHRTLYHSLAVCHNEDIFDVSDGQCFKRYGMVCDHYVPSFFECLFQCFGHGVNIFLTCRPVVISKFYDDEFFHIVLWRNLAPRAGFEPTFSVPLRWTV